MGDNFSTFLDKYPVSPYLCSRDTFMRWVHFIHNNLLGKEEISLYESLDRFNRDNVCDIQTHDYCFRISNKTKKELVFAGLTFIGLCGILVHE